MKSDRTNIKIETQKENNSKSKSTSVSKNRFDKSYVFRRHTIQDKKKKTNNDYLTMHFLQLLDISLL